MIDHQSVQQKNTAPQSDDQLFEKLIKWKLRKTRLSYRIFLKRCQESFKKKTVTVQQIAKEAKLYSEQPGISYTALSRLTSMDAIWASFEEHTSWCNSELVEAVVGLYGDERDQRNLEEFKSDRMKLVCHMDSTSDGSEKATMILKLEEDFNHFSPERLDQVRLTLCDLLETITCPLDKQEGCVVVTMSIAVKVAEDTFPLSPARKKAFHNSLPTLIYISCGGVTTSFDVHVSAAFSL